MLKKIYGGGPTLKVNSDDEKITSSTFACHILNEEDDSSVEDEGGLVVPCFRTNAVILDSVMSPSNRNDNSIAIESYNTSIKKR